MRRLILAATTAAMLAAPLALTIPAWASTTLTIGIGTQNTTTNTVTAGVVVKELHLLEKFLPHEGKYADIDYKLDWQNFTSGPPVTNGMVAGKLQFGMMGDYPLIVNGYTFESNPDSKSRLISVIAYNMQGSGNGVVVNVTSPYYSLADLKGKVVSVPFGSAAHGMLLKALEDAHLPPDFFHITNQSPEVGATNLQEMKIDAHADFVPFVQLLPFKGFAREIFDGSQTHVPTWHGIVVRSDFADTYPEIPVAFLRAMLAANAWLKADPVRAAEKIEEWTGTAKEVVYVFLGPGGNMTIDPTLKPKLLDAAQLDVGVLKGMGRMKDFDVRKWADDSYLRAAMKADGLDYDTQITSTANYQVTGQDSFCGKPVTDPKQAGEIWVTGKGVLPYSSVACTLAAWAADKKVGTAAPVAYVPDAGSALKLFADKAFYVIAPSHPIAPYLLKADAEADAQATGGRLTDLAGATEAAGDPRLATSN
jgi:NitT/TauT family transport system substrate-binding protein